MEKQITYQYTNVLVSRSPRKFKGNYCLLKTETNIAIGMCSDFRTTSDGLVCSVRTHLDIRGLSPVMHAVLDMEGLAVLDYLEITGSPLNVEEGIQPFI